MPANRS